MKRTFIIGSEWLYYKIYSGPKTADRVLTEVIKPVTEILLDENIIDSWFFIRYADPKQHIRVRFHHKESHLQIRTIQLIHELLMPFIDTGMIWKVLTDTYNREIERYGKSLIEPTEQFLFFYDSMMVVNILDQIEGDEGEKLRWMIGLRAVNEMLEIFRFNDIEKSNFIQKLRDGFGEEFGMNKDLKSQLSDKYRNEKKSIESIMDKNNDTNSEYAPLIEILNEKQKNITSFANDLMTREKENRLEIPIDKLMWSYLHMMCNRLFKSKQRLHELVLYDFLGRYYASQIARKKQLEKDITI